MKSHLIFSLLIVSPCILNSIIQPLIQHKLIASIIFNIIGVLFLKAAFILFDNTKPEFSNVIISLKTIVFYLIFYVLYLVMTLIGSLLLIVPGIICLLRLSLASFLIIDKELAPIDAMRRSWIITKGYTWNLFLFGLPYIVIIGLANYLSVEFDLISAQGFSGILLLFITLPTFLFASIKIYRTLEDSPHSNEYYIEG